MTKYTQTAESKYPNAPTIGLVMPFFSVVKDGLDSVDTLNPRSRVRVGIRARACSPPSLKSGPRLAEPDLVERMTVLLDTLHYLPRDILPKVDMGSRSRSTPGCGLTHDVLR